MSHQRQSTLLQMVVLVEMSSVRKHVTLFFRHRDEFQHLGVIGVALKTRTVAWKGEGMVLACRQQERKDA